MKTKHPIHSYNNGQPYLAARGRLYQQHTQKSITHLGQALHPIVRGFPTTDEFLLVVKRELKIRYYSRQTIKNYLSYLRAFLCWFGDQPHKVTLESVRQFLEMLVDAGTSSSHLAGNLSAIRTAFDKFCGRDVTLGLVTPKKKKIQPFVLSRNEVARMIEAAPRQDIKLALGLMYALGLRNSEVCSLRARDFDFDRNVVRIDQGKGRSDRWVILPTTFRPALHLICNGLAGEDFIFRSQDYRSNRHISSRTLQRWVEICVQLTGIKKRITPHSFRHAFATHLLENGTDVRFIQKLLGHKQLETTTLYTRLADMRKQNYQSPLDALDDLNQTAEGTITTDAARKPPRKSTTNRSEKNLPRSVGTMTIDFSSDVNSVQNITLRINNPHPVELRGISCSINDSGIIHFCYPVVEAWRAQLKRLPASQRQRISEPSFMGRVHQEVVRRLENQLRPVAKTPSG